MLKKSIHYSMQLQIDRFSGDYIILQSHAQFLTLKQDFSKCTTYEERLQFFSDLSCFTDKFREGSLFLRITYKEAYGKVNPIAEEDQIDITPDKTQLLICIQWVVDLPDSTAQEWIQQYEELEQKEILAEVRAAEFLSLLESDSYFKQLYTQFNQEGLKLLLFRYTAASEANRPSLSQLVFTLRRVIAWSCFLRYIGAEDVYKLSASAGHGIAGIKIKTQGTVIWKEDSNSLILLIKLLWEKGYIEAPSLKEAFAQTGQFFGKDLKYVHDAIAKMYDRNNNSYQNKLIRDLLQAEQELRNNYEQKQKDK